MRGIPSQCPPVGTTAAICITKTRTTYEILPTSFIPLGPAELHLHLLRSFEPSNLCLCLAEILAKRLRVFGFLLSSNFLLLWLSRSCNCRKKTAQTTQQRRGKPIAFKSHFLCFCFSYIQHFPLLSLLLFLAF